MILRRLQRRLEAIYRLEPFPPMDRFLLSAEELRRCLPAEEPHRPILLVQQKGEEICLGVHLGDALLQRLLSGGDGVDFSDFCTVVEEISHFVFLCWSVRNSRSVCLLDLELQAEIDKFLLATQYFSPAQVSSWIFEKPRFDARLNATLLERYQRANTLALRFTRALRQLLRLGKASALQYLRAFYRQGSARRLAQAARL